jgi:hypothetical protein
MAEAHRLRFDPVHQDDAHARERVVVELAVRGTGHLAPGELLGVERHAFLLQDVERHAYLRCAKVRCISGMTI